MLVYAVDIGTTNLKVVLYDERLRALAVAAAPARYDREGERVEFDPDALVDRVVDLIGRCASGLPTAAHPAVIVFTGQAESLVLRDGSGRAVRPAMSWLDDRAAVEAVELGERFGVDRAFAVTGQPAPSATWPAAKLRWLARHEPEVLARTERVLMVKDDLVLRFTGTAAGELSTRGFSYLFDVPGSAWWGDMLDFCSVSPELLAEVVPAGADVGAVTPEIAERLPPSAGYRVNAGALDHFAAMAGTDSYRPGSVSESAGTVLSLSLLATDWSFDPAHRVSFHRGLGAEDIVLFNGVDSGGVALEWYRREGLGGLGFAELEGLLSGGTFSSAPLFLPYLTGVNPPDYFPDARGAFLDLVLAHDRVDLAFAVEEGIAHLLRRNIEALAPGGVDGIVSTGGGAASDFWNQLKADVCDVDLMVPAEHEATCRGAAALGLLAAGEIGSLSDVAALSAPSVRRFAGRRTPQREARYRRFEHYLTRLYGGPAPMEDTP